MSVKIASKVALIFVCLLLGMIGCDGEDPSSPVTDVPRSVPRAENWGIYALGVTTEAVELIYNAAAKIGFLNLNKAGDTLSFSQHFAGSANENEEICTIKIDGTAFRRITDNDLLDTYPVWSPDGTQLAFLSWRDRDLDIYVVEIDGSNQRILYDSGSHDAYTDYVCSSIVFTSGSRVWLMRDDGTVPVPITDPPCAGVWGDANLLFGDYDTRLSPDGQK